MKTNEDFIRIIFIIEQNTIVVTRYLDGELLSTDNGYSECSMDTKTLVPKQKERITQILNNAETLLKDFGI